MLSAQGGVAVWLALPFTDCATCALLCPALLFSGAVDELKDVAKSLRRLPVVEPELPTVRDAIEWPAGATARLDVHRVPDYPESWGWDVGGSACYCCCRVGST